MGIRVEHFPDPRAPENLITVAYNREEDGNGERFVVARLSADTLTWMRQDGPFTLTEGSIKNVIEVQSEPVPMLSQLIIEADKAFYAKQIQELQSKLKAQDTELRQLKRQLSLKVPLAETSPTKAQAQAVAMKGKSILNPRLKRAKQSKGIAFEDSDDPDE